MVIPKLQPIPTNTYLVKDVTLRVHIAAEIYINNVMHLIKEVKPVNESELRLASARAFKAADIFKEKLLEK